MGLGATGRTAPWAAPAPALLCNPTQLNPHRPFNLDPVSCRFRLCAQLSTLNYQPARIPDRIKHSGDQCAIQTEHIFLRFSPSSFGETLVFINDLEVAIFAAP